MKKIAILLPILALLLVTSCGTTTNQQIVYLQDTQEGVEITTESNNEIVLAPQDIIAIIVSSKDPELSMLFNAPYISQSIGSDNSPQSLISSMQRGEITGYTVDSKGYIDYPVLGKIKVAGMTRLGLANYIKQQLIDNGYVLDPIVTVSFQNLSYSMMGEVKVPGRYQINEDQLTLLEVISKAGDLTIYGKRDNVKVTRKTPNGYITYNVDLRSTDMFSSPAFYIQQGDVIYVEPNKVKSNQSTVNANNVMSATFWLSIASVAANIATLIVYRVY